MCWGRDTDLPEHYVFEELAGLVRVHVLRFGRRDQWCADLGAEGTVDRHQHSRGVIASCAGLAEDDIATMAHTPLVASVGTPFVIAEVASVEALSRARPDIGAFRAAAERFPEVATRFSLHLYARRGGDATRLAARMFAPLGGILEDPATGSANAALAALLTSLAPGENADLSYEILQGVEMGRPSQIIASARKTAEGPVLATVEGSCVPVLRGTVEL